MRDPEGLTPTSVFAEIRNKAGGLRAAAARLGIAHPTLLGWEKRGQIPPTRAREVAEQFGIPLSRQRPDIWPRRSSAGV